MIYGTARDRNISRLLRFLKRWPIFPVCGNALWQPIYVEDLADAVLAALDSPGSIGQGLQPRGRRAATVRRARPHRGARRRPPRPACPVPIAAAVLAARLTRIVSPEQVRRLAEDKAFAYADAARDFGFAPRSFDAGVRLEARALGL